MGLPGRKPTEDRSQVRFKGHVAEWTEVEDVPFADPPAMPDRDTTVNYAEAGLVPGSGWPESTQRWWRVICRMPHCALWTDGDWAFAMDTMETHARFAEGWRGATGAELRQREKLMGVYHDARRDLRIRYVEPKAKTKATGTEGGASAGVSRMSDYRNL